MVDTYDTGGLWVSEAEHGQTGIPDAVLCDDAGLFSSFIYLPYIYGDVLSISFGIILFYGVAAYEHSGQKRYIALASFAAGLAVLARKIHGSFSLP